MERYSIHVLRHQITPRKGSRNQWTVLAAIEHMTGCINLRIFKAKEGAQELSVTHIADFIEDTIDRLALPIKKVEISAVTLEVINELVNKLPNYQIQQGDATDTQARYPIPDNLSTAVKFCEFLSAAVNDHNDTYGKSKLIAERKEIYEEYQRVRDKKRRGWNLTKIKLMYPETPAGPLMTFCKRHFKTDAAVIMVRSLELRMRNPSQ